MPNRETLLHQFAKSKHFKESGKPAWRKQEVTWTKQDEAAVAHPFASTKSGMGVEHQLPHLYSQVGAEVTVAVAVHSLAVEAVVFDVVVTTDEEDEVEGFVEGGVELGFDEDDVELDELDVDKLDVDELVVDELELEDGDDNDDDDVVDEAELELELADGGLPPIHGIEDSISNAT